MPSSARGVWIDQSLPRTGPVCCPAARVLFLRQAPSCHSLAADTFLGGVHRTLDSWFLLQRTQAGSRLQVRPPGTACRAPACPSTRRVPSRHASLPAPCGGHSSISLTELMATQCQAVLPSPVLHPESRSLVWAPTGPVHPPRRCRSCHFRG